MNKVLKDLFWDTDFNKIDSKKNASTVIERVLDFGDIGQIKVMFRYYNQEKVEQVLKTSKRLTAKSANFWADYFELQKKDVPCLSKQSKQIPKNSWPY